MVGHDGQTLGYDAAGARPFSSEPSDPTGHTPEHAAQAGLTKRERFALAAQAALLGASERPTAFRDSIAREAVAHADALIAALNAQPVVGDMGQITGAPDDDRR